MNPKEESMFKFGIDWSENHHNLCIRNDKGAIVSQVEFKHTLDGFQRFDDERRKLGVPPSECIVAIETCPGRILSSAGISCPG
jgi:transposase